MATEHIVLLGGIALAGIVLAVVVALLRHRAENRTEATARLPVRLAGQADNAPTPTMPTQIINRQSAAPTSTDDGLDWLALAADELRTPLIVLRGQIEFLHQNISNASRQSLITIAERLIFQVEQLEQLVEAWTTTARQSGPQRTPTARPIELLALARNVCARLTRVEDPPFDVADGPPLWVLLDPISLEHAFTVLLRSARQSSPNGLIEVVVRTVGEGEGKRICIAVADRRPPPRGHSANLWASLEHDLVRVLIEEHNGWLEMEPRGGGGAVTTIWLPPHVLIPVAGQHGAAHDYPRQHAA